MVCAKVAPGQPRPAGQGNCAWYDPSDPDPLHLQSMTYDKANETLSELTFYLEAKLNLIRDPEAEEKKVVEALGDFCPEGTPGTLDDKDSCLARYERFNLLYLQKVKAAIARNNTSAASLLSRQVDARTGQPIGQGQDVMNIPPSEPPGGRKGFRSPIMSYLPSYDELRALAQQEQASRGLNPVAYQASITNEFAEWLKSKTGYSAPPRPEDFPKFKRILRDPNNPSAGYFEVVDKDPATGKAKPDDAAFNAAMAAYASANPEGVLREDADKLLEGHFRSTTPKNPALEIKKPLKRGVAAFDPEKSVPTQSTISITRQAFGAGRHSLLKTADDVALKNVSAPPKKPAFPGAKASPKPGTQFNALAPSANSNPSPSGYGSSTSVDAGSTAPSQALNKQFFHGNEAPTPLVGNAQNQNNSSTIHLDLKKSQRQGLEHMYERYKDDYGSEPSVQLPPAEGE